MSRARERLIAAWSTLARDIGTAAYGHYSLHSRGAPKLPSWFKVSSRTKCEPAATGNAGEVRVPLDPTRQHLDLRVSPIWRVSDPNAVPPTAVLRNPPGLSPGSILVAITSPLTIGTYVGFLSDGPGPPFTYFVIYVDGLS